ncbi:MAG: hypothetical protein MI862_10395 [Desulfobacterales bacterium]|nr:hypothetical protein [Desulfobacterales bacterium]
MIIRVGCLFSRADRGTLIHHTVPPAVVPPCSVWLIRPQSARLAPCIRHLFGGRGKNATHARGKPLNKHLMVDLGGHVIF